MFSKKHPHLQKIELFFEDFDPDNKFEPPSLVEEEELLYGYWEEDDL